MWAVVALLGFVVTTWVVGVSWFAWLAAFHDGLAVVLIEAWIVAGYAVAVREWILAAAAGALIAAQLVIIIPRLFSARLPEWIAQAPRLVVVGANVFVGNRHPEVTASGLLATDADVIVITEYNDAFMRGFASVGGTVAYPQRIDEPSDRPDYATSIAARVPLSKGPDVVRTSTLSLVWGVVRCGGRDVSIVGVHLVALTGRNGFGAWRNELRELERLFSEIPKPFVVVGDFNATQFRPAFARLVRANGMRLAHDTLGRGLTGSLKLAGRGALSRVPALGRVDHALFSGDVFPVRVENRPAAGSDHRPFRVTFAVRPDSESDAR